MKTPYGRHGPDVVTSARRTCRLCLMVWLSFTTSTMAASFISDEADFLKCVGASQNFLNEFTDLVEENQYAHPMKYASNGLACEITSIPVFQIYSRTGFVSTASSDAEIVVSFTGAHVRAAGGLVFLTDALGAPTNGDVRVVLGTANTNTVPTTIGQPAFAGFFTGSIPFARLQISSQTPGAYPALDHFLVAEGVPLLTIAPSGPSGITIRWPAPATGYVLQFSLSLSNPGWTDVQVAKQPDGNFWQVTVPIQDSAAYFRLVRR